MKNSIRIGDNTQLPALLAIKAKGFKIEISCTKIDGKIDLTYPAYIYNADREEDIYHELIDSAPIYDLNGNIVED